MIRVTTTDTETGESESIEIEDDWVLTCAGDYYLHHVTKHANGTAVITVKRRDREGTK